MFDLIRFESALDELLDHYKSIFFEPIGLQARKSSSITEKEKYIVDNRKKLWADGRREMGHIQAKLALLDNYKKHGDIFKYLNI